ncbi:hypothetical protein [Actinomadura algeriensis]|uniref:Type VII secretion system (Wss) protein ESAT-6 n=1 Tax=Actinomadura algeriensis TaxID=1679523 RepID=A0ABR9JTU4_9ACTN|nr:hypothetical protein [Actinomadura algeriensis]MBE1533991.1 hypothetical protein [Actinomadura algeriensis]
MTDPITSEYDTDPIDPPDPDAEAEEGAEPPPPPDLGNTDSPDLTVWSSRPSFNDPPKPIGQNGSGEPPPEVSADSEPFSINLETMATQLGSMLSTSRDLVAKYEALRSTVLSTQATVFGQESEEDDGLFDFSTGQYWDWTDGDAPTVWQEPAKRFAEHMNPAQQKALQHIGGVLELVGEYIALANHTGQTYSEADRNSKFPPPPGNSVTG